MNMCPAPENPVLVPTRKRRWWLILLVVALVFLAGIVAALWLVRAEPSYWEPVDANDPAVAATAERIESRITSQTTSVRPPNEVWELQVGEDQVNAWLAARLPLWLANQQVDRDVIQAVPQAMIDINLDRVELAVQVRLDGLAQIVRFAYRPQADGEQPMELVLKSVYAGRLRVPLELLVEQVRARAGLDAQDADRIVRHLQSVPLRLALDDGRIVTVTDVQLGEGVATLTCRTRPAGAS